MCFSKKQKKILGRWLEGMGIGLMTTAMISHSILAQLFWYWFSAGTVAVLLGGLLDN